MLARCTHDPVIWFYVIKPFAFENWNINPLWASASANIATYFERTSVTCLTHFISLIKSSETNTKRASSEHTLTIYDVIVRQFWFRFYFCWCRSQHFPIGAGTDGSLPLSLSLFSYIFPYDSLFDCLAHINIVIVISRRRLVTAEREERIHAMLSCCMVRQCGIRFWRFCHFYSQIQFFLAMVHHLSFDMVHLNHNRTAVVYTKRISTRFYHNSSLLMPVTAFGGVSFSRDSCRIINSNDEIVIDVRAK